MNSYTVNDAKHHLSDLIEEAQQGVIVVILDGKNQAVQLVPIMLNKQSRMAGSSRGLIHMADDFDAPLADFDEYGK